MRKNVLGVIASHGRGPRLQPAFSATGGTITTSGAYTIHTFTVDQVAAGNGSFVVTGSKSVEYLIVGGGGSGGAAAPWGGYGRTGAGGGGGGGVLTGTTTVTSQTYSIVVGAGGAAPSFDNSGVGNASLGVNGESGGNSSFAGFTAIGGGGGAGGAYTSSPPNTTAGTTTTGRNGIAGGCGGGAVAYNRSQVYSSNTAAMQIFLGTGGAGTSGQGFRGGTVQIRGTQSINPSFAAAGGGGGASAIGGDYTLTVNSGAYGPQTSGMNGGEGVTSSISGTSRVYGSGGGGGQWGDDGYFPGYIGNNAGTGAGSGFDPSGAPAYYSATPNQGGGGGGGADAGAAGVVIIRYLT